MKVFYWTEPSLLAPPQFVQVNTETGGAYVVDDAGVNKENIMALLEDHAEISWQTAAKMGLPS